VIENIGIAPESGTATFYVNDEKSEFSSFEPAIAGRNGMKTHPVTVQAVTFGQLLAKHGVPYYLKVDIERADGLCLMALDARDLPKYVSIEAHELEYLLRLWCLGYRHFKVIDQMRHNAITPLASSEDILSRAVKHTFWYVDRLHNKLGRNLRFAPASSGPFGEETLGEWQTLEDVAYNWIHLNKGYSKRGTLNRRSWHDFHAKRD
jgi:Methyltransferase FkbM domain